MSTEAQARIKINSELKAAGWRFFQADEKQANIRCEHRITKKKFNADKLGDDFENGFINYLLLYEHKRPIAFV